METRWHQRRRKRLLLPLSLLCLAVLLPSALLAPSASALSSLEAATAGGSRKWHRYPTKSFIDKTQSCAALRDDPSASPLRFHFDTSFLFLRHAFPPARILTHAHTPIFRPLSFPQRGDEQGERRRRLARFRRALLHQRLPQGPGQQTDGVVCAGAIGLGDHRGVVLVVGRRRRGVRHGVAVRGVQVPPPQVPAGLRVRALLPAGQPAEVRARAPRLRREQRDQAAKRAPPLPARGRRELARLRGRHAPPGPRLRLRRRHLHPPAQPPPAPAGPRPRQVRALQVPGGGGGGFCVDGVERRAASHGRVHRQRDAQRRSQLHQHWPLGGARLHRRLPRRVRAGAVRQRADAVQELRRRAHREAGDQRRVRVRVLDGDGRRWWACLWPRDARHQPVLEVRHRRRRREAQRRAVGRGSIVSGY